MKITLYVHCKPFVNIHGQPVEIGVQGLSPERRILLFRYVQKSMYGKYSFNSWLAKLLDDYVLAMGRLPMEPDVLSCLSDPLLTDANKQEEYLRKKREAKDALRTPEELEYALWARAHPEEAEEACLNKVVQRLYAFED